MPTETAGATFSFRTTSGEVIGTDQRSDSYTTGSSRTVIYEGSGGGSGHVDTEVVVNRDIWVRDGAGQEHHVRIRRDVPVRVGQHVAFVYLKAKRPVTKRSVDDLASVHVLSTDRCWTTRKLGEVALALIEPQPSWGALAIPVMWVASLALCVVGGIGVPLVIALFVLGRMRESKKKALAAELAKALETGHLDVVQTAHRDFLAAQKRLAALEASKPQAIGVAS